MGWKWEVNAWVRSGDSYAYEEVYTGDSLIAAIRAARKAKKAGSGCVKVEWR